ncbi:Nat2p KNAG_0C03020 [Huiozyma naganishii CBS 8797]|uniref:DUF1279 domain-containing protein n=1 Tax=Huiozyma naganishii (strain ATCC MYA-139 / BCRC 22969 / CBS 8797 / KCTC 17520 / NBRC 10181 / NCYC 3082 / Yp74L-3) TaxID=1071383 RepID=J7RIR3_HUIN7|nr:hypothetical protein KNAG_0C03020 [Kazachstania naganishii CBS 8797]CCK69413.1 hypothetical protein KNAG_0C03020 [Kazachstania naganishii CBS 8797]
MFSRVTRAYTLFSARESILLRTRGSLRATNGRSITTETAKRTVKQDVKGIKKLMTQYGYSALIVYIGITFISLPLCFFTVHSFGEERMSLYLNKAKRVFGYGEPDEQRVIDRVRAKKLARLEIAEDDTWWTKLKRSPILAEFLIAYGLHKSLVFVRIPATAAITPSMARVLRRAGFTRLTGGAAPAAAGAASRSTLSPNGVDIARQKTTKGEKWFNGLF